MAMVVLEPSLQSHKSVCSVIFTAPEMPNECERVVYEDGEDLGESIQLSAVNENSIRIDLEEALLMALIALVICYLYAIITIFS